MAADVGDASGGWHAKASVACVGLGGDRLQLTLGGSLDILVKFGERR